MTYQLQSTNTALEVLHGQCEIWNGNYMFTFAYKLQSVTKIFTFVMIGLC